MLIVLEDWNCRTRQQHLIKEPVSVGFGFTQGHNILAANRGTEQYPCKQGLEQRYEIYFLCILLG